MEVDLIFEIAAIGIIVAVMNQVLSRSDKGEYAMLITLAGIILVVIMVIPHIEELFSDVRDILDFWYDHKNNFTWPMYLRCEFYFAGYKQSICFVYKYMLCSNCILELAGIYIRFCWQHKRAFFIELIIRIYVQMSF